MSDWVVLAAAPAAATVGALAGGRLRLPAGSFMGALAGVGVMLALLGFPDLRTPAVLGQGLQVAVGILVGLKITPDAVRTGARAFVPATVLATVFLLSGVAAALAAVSLTGMKPETAVFAAAPGGLTEMASVGASLGADGPSVAAIHLTRLLLVILAANLLLARVGPGRTEAEDGPGATRTRHGRLKLWTVVASGVGGGALGLAFTPLPAGGVVGSLLGSGAARMIVAGEVPERGFALSVQVFAGGFIGLGLSAEFFRTLAQLAGTTLIVNSVQMLVWVGAGFLLVRFFRYDPTTATFAAAPGGMGTLLSITGETDADLVVVAFTHLFRLSATIVVVPLLVASAWI